jgi:aconitate hydratase
MRAKAGDPPRTMAQKILVGRADDPSLTREFLTVKVDQIVLARSPETALAEAARLGMRKANVEVAVAYDGPCVEGAGSGARRSSSTPADLLARGVLVARAGVGFAAPVHLERFASPARLCVTDEPRLAGVGGGGMLSIVVSPAQLGQALATGTVVMRPLRSVQVLLTGRTRPFVCARDVSLELVRRGLGDIVRKTEEKFRAPVVVEFAGPSVRALSVSERAVLASIAPQVGAVSALFVGDERTEVFLRDQRRSKAHRALVPDAGAPCDDLMNLDLGAVDPLLLDEDGVIRSVRELAGKRVTQVLLGGDSGTTLRDLLAAATLLKAKRVPSHLDFLVAIPSRQALEVLAATGALADLLATGARLIEPDARVMRGELYPAPAGGTSVRTCDPEPRGMRPSAIVASAETLACAVATGEIADPRSFKRPVRVTVPRTLPTDDVLVVRERRGAAGSKGAGSAKPIAVPSAPPPSWRGSLTLDVVDTAAWLALAPNGKGEIAVACGTLDDVREMAAKAAELSGRVRAVLATFIPTAIVAIFSAAGIIALEIDAAAMKRSKGKVVLPEPAEWSVDGPTAVSLGGGKASAVWLAKGPERAWATLTSGRAAPSTPQGALTSRSARA